MKINILYRFKIKKIKIMRSITFLGFIIIGKCINNEMILKLNEDSVLAIIMLACLLSDLIYFIKKMSKD